MLFDQGFHSQKKPRTSLAAWVKVSSRKQIPISHVCLCSLRGAGHLCNGVVLDLRDVKPCRAGGSRLSQIGVGTAAPETHSQELLREPGMELWLRTVGAFRPKFCRR